MNNHKVSPIFGLPLLSPGPNHIPLARGHQTLHHICQVFCQVEPIRILDLQIGFDFCYFLCNNVPLTRVDRQIISHQNIQMYVAFLAVNPRIWPTILARVQLNLHLSLVIQKKVANPSNGL